MLEMVVNMVRMCACVGVFFTLNAHADEKWTVGAGRSLQRK